MKTSLLRDLLNLEPVAGAKGLDRDVLGGYCGDLLSDVMAHAAKGMVWLTVQSHQNIVAVAVLKELAAIVLVNGRQPDDDTLAKAEAEGVPVFVSPLSAFEVVGILNLAGIGGNPG